MEFGNRYLKDLNTGQNIISGEAFAAFSKDGELSLCGEVLCGIGKWYEVQIYDNETLVRDLVPAKNSSGTVGLYDNVGGVFYTNAGTGDFAGEIASGPVEGTGVSLVDGVSYGINDGKCMVGGTAYLVSKGMTMVGGTAYLIGEAAKPIPVTITGSGSASKCYVQISGKSYYDAASGIEVFAGESVRLYAKATASTISSFIDINGQSVSSGKEASYTWIVPKCNAINIKFQQQFSGSGNRYVIYVTTT